MKGNLVYIVLEIRQASVRSVYTHKSLLSFCNIAFGFNEPQKHLCDYTEDSITCRCCPLNSLETGNHIWIVTSL